MKKFINKIADATAEAFIFFISVLLANIILLSLIAGMVYFYYSDEIMQVFDTMRTSN